MKKSKKTPVAAGDDRVVKAAIYPGIGVARLGNSQNDFYIGPEVPDPAPEPPGFYRDAIGALKREAARFRIYGLNAEGRAGRGLTAKEAKIERAGHLANKKSPWYQFRAPIKAAGKNPPSTPANSWVRRSISANCEPMRPDGSSFSVVVVCLRPSTALSRSPSPIMKAGTTTSRMDQSRPRSLTEDASWRLVPHG